LLSVPRTRWRSSLALALLAWGPILVALGIVFVSNGMAEVRVVEGAILNRIR
jgi:hypothetical protein